MMATDYDAPRKTDEELNEDSIEELKTRRNDKNSGKVDEDEAEAAEAFELPGADLSHEELTVRVLPRQSDEFTCAGCFLVRHRSQIAGGASQRRRLLLRLRWLRSSQGAVRTTPHKPAGPRSSWRLGQPHLNRMSI